MFLKIKGLFSDFQVKKTLLDKKALLFSLLIFNIQPCQAEFSSMVDVGLGGDFYFTRESANNGQGFVNLLIQNTWSDSQLWLDIGAGGLVGESATSYVKAPQLYYRMGTLGRSHFTIGRALYDWSFADEFWNMGMVQPIFKWNEARPEQQGLTGAFLSFPVVEDIFEITFFGSLLYLPTQGPSFNVNNGELTSSNPWFNEPVQVINLSGEKADLNFDIDLPKTQEVIQQKSFGVLLGTPRNKKGWLASGFYLNKPRNELVLPFEGVLNLTTFNGDITVIPRVATHEVAGVDLGWNFDGAKTILSWIYEGKIEYDIPTSTTYPIYPDQHVFSATQLLRLTSTQKVWLGYIRTDRQPTEVGGVFANTQISAYLNRNRFDEAIRLKWEGLLLKMRSLYRVNASLAYNQSLVNNDVWVSGDVRWSLYKGLEVFTQCDIFGGSGDTIVGTDFIGIYQNNDRCFAGGHYAF